MRLGHTGEQCQLHSENKALCYQARAGMGLSYSSATKQDPGTGKQAELAAAVATASTEPSSEQFILPTRQADTEGTQCSLSKAEGETQLTAERSP